MTGATKNVAAAADDELVDAQSQFSTGRAQRLLREVRQTAPCNLLWADMVRTRLTWLSPGGSLGTKVGVSAMAPSVDPSTLCVLLSGCEEETMPSFLGVADTEISPRGPVFPVASDVHFAYATQPPLCCCLSSDAYWPSGCLSKHVRWLMLCCTIQMEITVPLCCVVAPALGYLLEYLTK